jgi:hypothetical protein
MSDVEFSPQLRIAWNVSQTRLAADPELLTCYCLEFIEIEIFTQ